MGLKAFNSGPRNNLLQAVSSEFGMTESECMHAVLSAVREGRMLDVMAFVAQADICDWIEEEGLLFGRTFLVVLGMGEKAIFCKSRVDMSGSDPVIGVDRVEHGTEGATPAWGLDLPTWEMPFWMMEIGGK